MIKKTILIILTLNSLFFDAMSAQNDPCSSMGTDTSFEYIKQVSLNTLNNLSGNNGGYGDFTNLNTELDLGQSYEITLTPGYKETEFNESWHIWIDYNNDGDYDDEGEEVLSLIASGQITSTIKIPEDISIRTVTSMRIAMKYNSAATPCEIFSFGEVEDYTIIINFDKEPCSDIISNGFELNYENWIDGGIDCSRVIENAITGNWSIRLRDNSGEASSLTTNDLALSTFEEVTIEFSYYPYSMEEDEDFWLQISTDGGLTYSTLRTWTSGKEFINETKYFESILIDNVSFSDNTRIRFRCDASANADQVYIDDIVINACIENEQELNLANNTQANLEEPPVSKPSINYDNISLTKTAFTVYPNPTSDKLSFMKIQGSIITEDLYGIKIIDKKGNIVKNIANISSIERYNLDITDLKNDVYFVVIDNQNGLLESHKIVVSK